MSDRFDYFVVFAEMRTGSNFLEANINVFKDLTCHGEVFNPHFIAYPDTETLMGFTQEARDADPVALVEAIKTNSKGKGGFRFFHDHDERILDHVVSDPRCAKIVLTRNPVESYVSWKIAKATGQWKLTNATHHKSSQVAFDREDFETHLSQLQAFQIELLNALQKSGQTAFYVAYEDIQDLDVMNGLAKFLGTDQQLESLNKNLKKQNPAPMSEKVANFEDMEASLAAMDRFDLSRTPNFEPRRGAAVPGYYAAAKAPLLFLPVKSGPEDEVAAWLAAVDGVERGDLTHGFNQKTLRQWKRQTGAHRSFTVVRHPVVRAHQAFVQRILMTGKGSFAEIRKTLRRVHNLPLPDGDPGADWTAENHKAAFLSFLIFVKANLGGQTAVRMDANWASQAQILQGFSEFAVPDMVIREDRLAEDLTYLTGVMGCAMPDIVPPADLPAIPLADFYDAEVEAAVRDVYQRDYMTFGFGPMER